MIVDERKVEIALDYLNADPAPVALARKEVADAENKCKRLWAQAFLDADGSVEARKAAAETDASYAAAQDEYLEAVKNLENERGKSRGAEMIIEVYRTESANTRRAERI